MSKTETTGPKLNKARKIALAASVIVGVIVLTALLATVGLRLLLGLVIDSVGTDSGDLRQFNSLKDLKVIDLHPADSELVGTYQHEGRPNYGFESSGPQLARVYTSDNSAASVQRYYTDEFRRRGWQQRFFAKDQGDPDGQDSTIFYLTTESQCAVLDINYYFRGQAASRVPNSQYDSIDKGISLYGEGVDKNKFKKTAWKVNLEPRECEPVPEHLSTNP